MSPPASGAISKGAIAQLGERVLCKHEVVGSIPSGSTRGVEVVRAVEGLRGPLLVLERPAGV